MKLMFKIIALILISNNAIAQSKKNVDVTLFKNNIKIGLMNTYFVNDRFDFGVTWEFKVAKKQSLQLGLSPLLNSNDDFKRSGVGLAVAYRKYISKNKEGLQGLYFSPGIKYGLLTEKNLNGYYDYSNPTLPVFVNKTITDKTNNFNASILFGKQWLYKSGFSLDISGGLGIFNNKFSTDLPSSAYYPYSYPYNYNNYRDRSAYGISPNLNLSIGYAF